MAATSIAVLVAAIFVASTLVAATDGQGAIVYLLSLPICGLLLWTAYRIARGRPFPRTVILAESFVLALFVVSAFVPPLRFFSASVAGGISGTFENIVGVSPYAWARQQSPAAVQLKDRLQNAETEISLSQVSVYADWNRLCIFGPYSTEEDAAKALGYYAATLAQSRVPRNDTVSALVFVNDKGTLGVIDINRSIVDFADLSRTCLTPGDFPLRIDTSSGRKVAKAGPGA